MSKLASLRSYASMDALDDPPFENLRDAILSVNDSHVYIMQHPRNVRILAILPSCKPLPIIHPRSRHSFCNDDRYIYAAQSGDRPVVLKTPRGNFVVVPIAKYASLHDFARKASVEEFQNVIQTALRLRKELLRVSGTSFYLETRGHDVPHFHVKLVTPANRAFRPQPHAGVKRWKVPY